MKKVSVVIPAFLPNKKYFDYLTQAAQSVFEQTYANCNLIIVFNGPYCEEIQGATNIFLRDKTSAATARNIGASIGWDCDYFAFLDADDCYYPNKIEKQIIEATSKNLDFIFTEADIIDGANNLCGVYPFENNAFFNDDIKNLLPYQNILISSSVMIKQETFFKCGMYPTTIEYKITGNPRHHNEKGLICEDYHMWFTAINKGYIFYKIPEILTSYRKNTSVER